MSATYVHKPLDKAHIRLITLIPGQDTIQISIGQAPFSTITFPRYEALSYTWGDPTKLVDSVEVISECTTVERKKPLSQEQTSTPTKLISSCHIPCDGEPSLALLHLRGNESRVLWIDAICINQNNPYEKSREIRKMGDIFRNAQRVVV
jgi:hypothetical protein